MNEKKLREQILLNLLIEKFKSENVTAELVKTVENEFYQISRKLEKGENAEKKKGLSASKIAKLGL